MIRLPKRTSNRMVARQQTSLRNVFKKDKKEGPVKDREKRIKEMDEVIKKDLE